MKCQIGLLVKIKMQSQFLGEMLQNYDIVSKYRMLRKCADEFWTKKSKQKCEMRILTG